MKSAHEYQRKAEECRQRASHAVHPDDKAGWLQAAQDWQNLALCAGRSAEQRGLAAALSAVQDIQCEAGSVGSSFVSWSGQASYLAGMPLRTASLSIQVISLSASSGGNIRATERADTIAAHCLLRAYPPENSAP